MEPEIMLDTDTIVAVSTPPGIGGIAVVRLSGKTPEQVLIKCWKGADIAGMGSHTAHLGKILLEDESVLDEVVLTIFRAPRSYTGETVVELSCHGSRWIQRELVNLLIRHGARPAGPGEFTQRAFINGRLDLAQAEGVIDLISSSSRASHKMAMKQANGRFTAYLDSLREKLVEFASLLELELDFSEEEVEFADRRRLRILADELLAVMRRLADSYSTGKALKDGVPVVIAGAPNAGKSTLLNQLLDEEKAIVSDIPGTTRDVIEDTCEINGILFRFADTAGLRDASDTVERIGIERAEKQLAKASIALWVIDMAGDYVKETDEVISRIKTLPEAAHIILINKCDLANINARVEAGGKKNAVASHHQNCIANDVDDVVGSIDKRFLASNVKYDALLNISASSGRGLDELKEVMAKIAWKDYNPDSDVILSNGRQYAALLRGAESLERAREALDTGLSADFIAQDVREALHHLATVTGSITTPDLLTSIFSRFCIGK